MKKKLTSLVLALVMCLSLCVPAFATAGPARVNIDGAVIRIGGESTSVTPRSPIYYLITDDVWTSSSTYQKNIGCQSAFGNHAEISIDNRDGPSDLIVDITDTSGKVYYSEIVSGGGVASIPVDAVSPSTLSITLVLKIQPFGNNVNFVVNAWQTSR